MQGFQTVEHFVQNNVNNDSCQIYMYDVLNAIYHCSYRARDRPDTVSVQSHHSDDRNDTISLILFTDLPLLYQELNSTPLHTYVPFSTQFLESTRGLTRSGSSGGVCYKWGHGHTQFLSQK